VYKYGVAGRLANFHEGKKLILDRTLCKFIACLRQRTKQYREMLPSMNPREIAKSIPIKVLMPVITPSFLMEVHFKAPHFSL
jgi:hypothetical protein